MYLLYIQSFRTKSLVYTRALAVQTSSEQSWCPGTLGTESERGRPHVSCELGRLCPPLEVPRSERHARQAAAAGWLVPAEPTVPRLNSQVRRVTLMSTGVVHQKSI
eukprot:scaffold60753_cov65-Phaeocystis_antarctica.AAC.2